VATCSLLLVFEEFEERGMSKFNLDDVLKKFYDEIA
jgi:hypothetical protein